jgi:phosphatidate cytidylyltransferase
MKRVLTAAVLIPFVLLLVFRAPLWLFALAVAGIVVLTIHEYIGIIKAYGIEPMTKLCYVAAIMAVVSVWLTSTGLIKWSPLARGTMYPVWLVLLPFIFGTAVVFRREMKMALPAAASSAFGVFYIAVALSLLIPMHHSFGGEYLIVFVLFSVWAGDIAAYYVGRAIGRHKLAPIVSPNKSWEGAVASVVASIAVAILIFHFHQKINSLFGGRPWPVEEWALPLRTLRRVFWFSQASWFNAVVLGALTNIAAQLGDLFESALKRGAGVKDSGTLLPGHGGILDRIDALLFAIPMVWYYATATELLQNPTFYTPISR